MSAIRSPLISVLLLASAALAGDKPAPVVQITSPADGHCTNQSSVPIIVAYEGKDPGQANVQDVDLLRDGQLLGTFENKPQVKSGTHTFTADLSALAEGTYSFQARAFQGNRNAGLSGTSNVVRITVDRTKPTITGLFPADGSFINLPRPTFSAAFADNRCGIDTASALIRLDGEDVTAQADVRVDGFSFVPAQPLQDGEHVLEVSIADHATNRTTATTRFVVDTVPPQIADLVPPDGAFLNNPRPEIAAGYSDDRSGIDASSVRMHLDAADVTAGAAITASDIRFTPGTPLGEGPHVASLSVEDRANNRATATATWIVDLTKPTLLVIEPQDGATVATATPAMILTYADALSGIDLASLVILLDGADITPKFTKGPTEATFTPEMMDALSEGLHTLTARILDGARNETVARSEFTIRTAQPDTTLPTVEIVFPRQHFFGDPTAFEGTSWRIVADARDPGPSASGIQKVEFFVDGIKMGEATGSPFETEVAFPEGIAGQTRVLTAVAEDRAGNRTISGSVTIQFVERPASGAITFRTSGFPATVQAGEHFPGPVTIEAVDAQGQVDPSYAGTIFFFTSDSRSFLRFGFTTEFPPEAQGRIQVDFDQLLFGTAPLFTAGQQVIAVADLFNPARDQGVISVSVQPGPPAILSFGSLPTPHGGQTLPVRVDATDAFGNEVPGVQVQLKVFEDNALTQTLLAETSSPAFFSVLLGGVTDRLRLSASSPSHPALQARELKRLVDAVALIEGLPEIMVAGDEATITYSVLNRTGDPIPDVEVETPLGARIVSAPFQEVMTFTRSGFASVFLFVSEGPLVARRSAFVQPGEPVSITPIFFGALFYIAQDPYGNPTPFEALEATLMIAGKTEKIFLLTGTRGEALANLTSLDLFSPQAVSFVLVSTRVMRTGQVLVSNFAFSLPERSGTLDPIQTFIAGTAASLPRIRLLQGFGDTTTFVVLQGVTGGGRHLEILSTPSVTSEGRGEVGRVQVDGHILSISMRRDPVTGELPTEITISNLVVQTTIFPDLRVATDDLLLLAAQPIFVGRVVMPGLRFFDDSILAGGFLGRLQDPKAVVLGGGGVAVPIPGPEGTEPGIASHLIAIAAADFASMGDRFEATVRSFTREGGPVKGGDLPTATSVELLRIGGALYASRPIRVVDSSQGLPLVGITPEFAPNYQTVGAEPLGSLTLEHASLGSSGVAVFGFASTVKLTLPQEELTALSENGARPLDFSIFRDLTPELRFRPVLPGFTSSLSFLSMGGEAFFNLTDNVTGRVSSVSVRAQTGNGARSDFMFEDAGGGEIKLRLGEGTPNPTPLDIGALDMDLLGAVGGDRMTVPTASFLQRIRALDYSKEIQTIIQGDSSEAFDVPYSLIAAAGLRQAVLADEIPDDQTLIATFAKSRASVLFTDPEDAPLTDSAISEHLCRNRVVPIGLMRSLSVVQARTYVRQDPLQQLMDFDNMTDRADVRVVPIYNLESQEAAENFQPVDILLGFQEATSGIPPAHDGAFTTSAVELSHQHFTMRTFAAHALVEEILKAAGKDFDGITPAGGDDVRTRIGVIDSGIGIGAATFPNLSLHRTRPPIILPSGLNTVFPTIVTNLSEIVDLFKVNPKKNILTPGHGTQVALAAGGDGNAAIPAQRVLGTGRHAQLKLVRGFIPDPVLQILHDDPNAHFESGFAIGIDTLLVGVTSDLDVKVITITEKRNGGAPTLERAVERAVLAGRIVVICAGQEPVGKTGVDILAQNVSPARLAPAAPRQAGANDSLVVTVAGLDQNLGAKPIPHTLWSRSNRGNNVSVAAPATELKLLDPTGTLGKETGTSLSTPYVGGILAEMIIAAEASGKTLAPVAIVELLQATARNLVGERQIGNDPKIGAGVVDAWRAVLSAANGGVAKTDNATPPLLVAGRPYPNVTEVPDGQTTWYGFEIRGGEAMQNATIWIDPDGPNNPLQPRQVLASNLAQYISGLHQNPLVNSSPLLPPGAVTMFQGVPAKGTAFPIPLGGFNLRFKPFEFLATFSTMRDSLRAGNIQGVLQVFTQGQQPGNGNPVFSLPLDLEPMRAGAVPSVSFDSFVFTIRIP